MKKIKAVDLENMSYFQTPRWLMNMFLSGEITTGGFKTYILMYDRLRISSKNKWIDEEGNVYIKYSYEELLDDLKCNSKTTVSNNIKELEKLGLILKIKCFNSSNIYYLAIWGTEKCSSTENYTSTKNCTTDSTEDCTHSSIENCTTDSTENLYTSKNNYNQNNIEKKIDDNNIYTIPEENLVDEETDVSSIEFKNNFLEYKEIVSKSTGIGMNIIDSLMANILHTLKSQYDIKFLIQKIKESDFLMGKLETRPSTANFSKKVMLDRIMADEYKNKTSSKPLEIKPPALKIIGDINPWEVED